MQELERGDSGLRSFVSVQGALVMYPIWRYGSDEQKAKWLPAMHAGKAIGCFGLTEPDHGSDPGGMETKAVKDGDGYVLNGAKMWITNGDLADVAVVWARLDGVVRGFLVERGTKGFTTREQKGKHSLRASVTSELILQDVRVPATAMLPGATGLSGPLSCLNQARVRHRVGGGRRRDGRATTRSRATARRASSSASPSRASSSTRRSSPHADRDHEGAAREPAASGG